MNAKQKYLKDENGQVISPVVSTDTVYDASGNTLGGGIVPIGAVLPYAAETAPLNYLICDGSTFSQSDYPELYSVLGKDYVPDLRSRFPLGLDMDREYSAKAPYVYMTGGEMTHTLTIDEMPSHNHSISGAPGWGQLEGYGTITPTQNPGGANRADIGVITNAGGGQSHNNMPPYISLNYIIRAK